jgi:hypothetical protein
VIAALYIDARGHYPGMAGVDCWDSKRDARLYAGPHPVVAHPPCQLWVNFACVRRFGGVLEHPAGSKAWAAHWLLAPRNTLSWNAAGRGEWTCEVWQSAYGHKARKRTWLYYCGSEQPASALWAREAGTHQVGWFDRAKPTLSKKEASATPLAFAEYLVSLARAAR